MPPALPFRVELSLSPEDDLSEGTLELEMISPDGLEETVDMLDCLWATSRWGVFSSQPSLLGGAVWTSAEERAGTCWRRGISVQGVQAAFWRIMLQMCVQCHYHLAPIKVLRVNDPARSEPGPSLEAVLRAPYPQPPRALPFFLRQEDDLATDCVTVRLSTASSIEDATLDQMRQALEDWGSLAYVGAFHEPWAAMSEYQLERVEVGRIHSTLLECAIFGWNANAAARQSLVALCVGLHHKVVPLVEVEFE